MSERRVRRLVRVVGAAFAAALLAGGACVSLAAAALAQDGTPETSEATVSSLLERADAAHDGWQGESDLRQALELYQQALALSPSSYEASWKAGRAAWQLAEILPKAQKRPLLERGRDLAERAVAANANGADGHYWYGVLIARVGEERGILASLFMVDDVMREMQATLAIDPQYPGAHHVLGVLYRVVPGRPLSIGDKRKSVEHAELAVKYAPQNVLYRLGLAQAYDAVGNRSAAVRLYREVLTMPGDDPKNDDRSREQARQRLKELGEVG